MLLLKFVEKTKEENTACGLGVILLWNKANTGSGKNGVDVGVKVALCAGVNVIEGVTVILGVRVIVGIGVREGVSVIVGDGGKY